MDHRSLRSLKSAIALSNIGAKLLERRQPCSALSTIQDALMLVRAALPENSELLLPAEVERLASQALLKASKAVAQSYQSKPDVPDGFSTPPHNHEPPSIVHVLEDSESPEIALWASSQGILASDSPGEAYRPIFALHMEDWCYAQEESTASLDLEIVAIMFNMASALRSLPVATFDPKQQHPREHLRDAFQLLQRAYTILGRRFVDWEACWSNETQTSRLLTLSMMVVQSLVALCPDVGVPLEERESLVQQLLHVYRAYAILVKSPCWGLQQYHSAAAA